jgi:SAM-dependent methyltransferase
MQELDPNRFITVTELSGDDVSREQVNRLCERYYWAERYCKGKDVVEVACGTGAGLGYLSKTAKSVVGGDISEKILEIPRKYYGSRVDLKVFGAEKLPFEDKSKDVIIIFEAIYYLTDVDAFLKECCRVLRPQGKLLIATANKDLFAFNPSPYSVRYYGVTELRELLSDFGFALKCFGACPLSQVGLKQKILQPVKKIAISLGLVPKTMAGKKLLKKFVFGNLVSLPAEILPGMGSEPQLTELNLSKPDFQYKVIFCEASLNVN